MSALRRCWVAFWALDRTERLATVKILIMAGVAEVVVRLVSLPKLASFLGIRVNAPETTMIAEEGRISRAQERAVSVDRVYRRWPRKGACLRRSLVLSWRLKDLDPVLMIGVARRNGEVRAHAWVEVDGRPVGREDGDFAPLRKANEWPNARA